jgi:hypothetical protein
VVLSVVTSIVVLIVLIYAIASRNSLKKEQEQEKSVE